MANTSRLIIVAILLSLLFCNGNIFAQDRDSLSISEFPEKKHSPRVASLMSTVLPGSGQIYNKKYWKAPIIWGGLAVSIYFISFNQSNFNIYDDAYTSILKQDTASVISILDRVKGESGQELVSTYEPQLKEFIVNGRKYYQRYMNLSYIAAGLIYFLNIIDAMVDAYLFDYDVSDKISMHVEPKVFGKTQFSHVIGLQCSLTFY